MDSGIIIGDGKLQGQVGNINAGKNGPGGVNLRALVLNEGNATQLQPTLPCHNQAQHCQTF